MYLNKQKLKWFSHHFLWFPSTLCSQISHIILQYFFDNFESLLLAFSDLEFRQIGLQPAFWGNRT